MIQTTEVSITYKGDGVQTSFPYPYPYRNSDDIVGYIINDVGYEKRITNNFKYDKVSNIYQYPLAGDPLAAPYSIKLIRETPQQQNADLPGKLPFSLIEKSLDWIIMILQEIGSRCNSLWHIRNDCKLSETNARNSASAAANSENLAKKWAMSPVSPDGVADTDSPTGYTQSAKIWAALSREYAGMSKFKLPIAYYNSVAEMKTSETALAGRPCVTLGYYEPNDSGGSVYVIRAKTEDDVDDGGSIIVLDNGNVAELMTESEVNVKQFGAKGDGVTDDTTIIQKVIDYTDQSTKHSIVYLPTGNYRITAPVYLRQDMIMCGDGNVQWQWGKISRGLTVGTTLIADFENIEDAAVVIASTDRNGVQNNFNHNRSVSGAAHDNGDNKACDNVKIKNITVYTAKNVAIGILGIVSTSCKLDLVSVIGFRYGVYVSACWGSSYTRLFVYTEFGGICLIDSAHDNCISNSYINRYDQQHELTDDNNLLPIDPGSYGKAKTGIYSRYSSGIHSNSNITEHWEIAYNMDHCTFVCNAPYTEGILKYCYQTLDCGMTINGPFAFSPNATFLRYINTNGTINGYSKYNAQFNIKNFVEGMNDDTLSSIVVSGIAPTNIEVTGKHLHYVDANPHEVYVDTEDGTIYGLGTKNSPVKNITNISFKETNTTVYLKYGQTINITSKFNLGTGKSITFNAYGDSKLARPKIVIIPVDPGSYSAGLIFSDSNVYFKNIDLEILEGDGQVQPDESQLFSVSGRTHVSFEDCNIKVAEHKALFSPTARWGEINFLSVWVNRYPSVKNTLTLGDTSMLIKTDYNQRSHITVCGMKDNDFFPQDTKYYTSVCTHYEDIIAATKAYLSK